VRGMSVGAYIIIAFIAFVVGFMVTWLATMDFYDDSTILITEEEIQQDCIGGLRNSAFLQKD